LSGHEIGKSGKSGDLASLPACPLQSGQNVFENKMKRDRRDDVSLPILGKETVEKEKPFSDIGLYRQGGDAFERLLIFIHDPDLGVRVLSHELLDSPLAKMSASNDEVTVHRLKRSTPEVFGDGKTSNLSISNSFNQYTKNA
jgi:hypothetical protein